MKPCGCKHHSVRPVVGHPTRRLSDAASAALPIGDGDASGELDRNMTAPQGMMDGEREKTAAVVIDRCETENENISEDAFKLPRSPNVVQYSMNGKNASV